MIPPEFLQQLLGRIDIVDVVGAHVQLKKSGASLKGLCPFHGEKTPSFHVSPSRQTYHCFGCGAHGDALRFLTEHLGLGFVDAVQDLARRAGLEVPDDRRSVEERAQQAEQKARQKDLSELLAQAAQHYRQQLKSSARAVEYLKQRGLSGRIAAQFGLGYAPAGWRGLARCFPDYADPQLEAAGLVISSEDKLDESGNPRRYDRFRDRIMFPIRNVAGAVIGFGGRVLDQGEPKYLNSPETPVFVKGQELYGLYEARPAIRRGGHALVVEGYMDVVALAQFGIGQAVATLGTACTGEHVSKLFRFTEDIVFSFDGDAAGRRAAARALAASLPHLGERRQVRFLFLPTEHDPDSYVREHGMAAFEACIADAQPLSRFLVEVASEGCRMDTPEGRTRYLAQAKPLWVDLPEGLLKRQMLGELARHARLDDAELQSLWQGDGGGRTPSPPQERQEPYAERGGVGGPYAKKPFRNARLKAPSGPLPIASPEDQLLRLLLLHSAWWESLSADAHARLVQRGTPHAKVFAWLDRQVIDHGALAWAELRLRLVEALDQAELPASLPALDLERLDEMAAVELHRSEMNRLLAAVLTDHENLSAILGRSAVALRPKG
ncbi:DNA primase [Inhella sp.]|uniref:DNA primase n=1 Tax=Inhella sp. TaxID=1921806 RepID=UPI0035B31FAC